MTAKNSPILYGFFDSPFGVSMLAKTEKGLCALYLRDSEAELYPDLNMLQNKRKGDWQRDDAALAAWNQLVFQEAQKSLGKIILDLEGTVFQKRVWKALLDIPSGQTVTYSDIAQRSGMPAAVRAAASAIGDNPICYLIPCHRVIRKDGSLGGYYSGLHRKKAMLDFEARLSRKAA